MGVLETLPSHKQMLIREHLRLVLDANEHINLTSIKDFEEGLILHIEDSLAGLQELNECPEGLYGDLGSGAGFPGIPLSIASERQCILVDMRKKKMECVTNIIEKLRLSDSITTYTGRAELLARSRPREFKVLTARALSRLVVLLELSSPLLSRGGRLLCYKAQLSEDELQEALSIQKLVGMQLIGDRQFELSDEYKRRILVFEKVANPRIKLPRQEGLAQKQPLSE